MNVPQIWGRTHSSQLFDYIAEHTQVFIAESGGTYTLRVRQVGFKYNLAVFEGRELIHVYVESFRDDELLDFIKKWISQFPMSEISKEFLNG